MNRLNNEDSLALVSLLGKKLALDLDAGDLSSLKTIAPFLEDLPVELLIVFFSHNVTLERVVRNSLDEDKVYGKLLMKMVNLAKVREEE